MGAHHRRSTSVHAPRQGCTQETPPFTHSGHRQTHTRAHTEIVTSGTRAAPINARRAAKNNEEQQILHLRQNSHMGCDLMCPQLWLAAHLHPPVRDRVRVSAWLPETAQEGKCVSHDPSRQSSPVLSSSSLIYRKSSARSIGVWQMSETGVVCAEYHSPAIRRDQRITRKSPHGESRTAEVGCHLVALSIVHDT